MAKSNTPTETESLQDKLSKEAQSAWDALNPIRETWDEKERALLAKTNDSFSGNVVRVKVTDAALSTLAFERQARVAAQLPTGKVNPTSSKEEGKAKLADIVLHRYIIPNANQQKPMLIKHRLWGVYASVYGSMAMFYDYRVDDDYIGPDCWLVDPRSLLPQPGRNSIKECDWVMISTVVTVRELESIAKRKNTSWDAKVITKLIKQAKEGKPSRMDDSSKDPYTSSSRYSKEAVKGQVELITKYEAGDKGHWQTFAPDYKDVGVLRDIPNPHKSGKIPVVMRDCFPLLNSIYGLGDFERGMKIQKAKDSLLGLRLEFVKNKVFPALKIVMADVTPATIKQQSGAKWRVKNQQAVQAMSYGQDSETGFQNTFSVLNGIQQSQFGTTDARTPGDESADPSVGRTPAAIKQNSARENARDTWDRFMHEQAVEELYEGMINLLSVKMEKPINFAIFEEEIRKISGEYGEDVLQVFGEGKQGTMTVAKKQVNSDKGYKYLIDANSSMQKDDETQLAALMQTYQMAVQDPNLQARLQQSGVVWDQAEHFKKIIIASGVSDWERILQQGKEQAVDPTTGQPLQGGQDQAMMQQQQQEQALQQQMAQEQQAARQQHMQMASQLTDPDSMALAEQMLGGMQ